MGSQSFSSISVAGTQKIPYLGEIVRRKCWGNVPAPADDEACQALQMARRKYVNVEATAAYLSISTVVDPVGYEGHKWMLAMRETLDGEVGKRYPFEYLLVGGAANSGDAIEAVMSSFPYMVGCTAGVVLLFVAVSYKSIVIPLLSVFTIGLTTLFVFGFATLTYVKPGIFNWTGWSGISQNLGPQEDEGSFLFIVPVICFALVGGLGLDYNIFIITRMYELRLSGHSTPDAIALGLARTGGIITSAGLIMAAAFGGLLFSSVSMMNSFSFIITFSVLFDSFVVRSLLMPTIMSLLPGDVIWWPKKMPRVTKRRKTRTFKKLSTPHE